MSAIAGLLMLDGSNADRDTIKNMLANLHNYGPDAQQHLQVGKVAFAHALLATTPEALNETQPWTDVKTGCIVVSDSRLDNRNLLATAVGLVDRTIDSIGDAELIFAAYQKWGNVCPEKLLGDFTFAIWNPATEYLFCARDPLGVRPFYYYHIEDKIFAFATSSEALRVLLERPVALNEGRLADAMTDHLEGYDHTSTFFRDIKRLPPAHCLSLPLPKLPELSRYWQPMQNRPSPFPSSEAQWLEQLEALFVDAVHCRLRTHLPIAAMLSGGLDSSAVVAIACEKLKADAKPILSTFSAISAKPNCAETRAIRLMQSTFQTKTHEMDPEKSPELLQKIADQWPQLEEPFEAFTTLVHAQYLRANQQKQRIMLDGIDADGLLTEADYLHDLARAGHWRRVWQESRALARFWGSEASLSYFLRPLVSEFLIPMPVRRVVRYLRNRFQSRNTYEQSLIKPEFAVEVDLEARYQSLQKNTLGSKTTDLAGHQGYSAMASSNSVVGVERYHRLASLYGIEPRHPFLDQRLVEFCAWLPLELRLRNGYPKWALRQTMDQRLPSQIAWRRGKEHLGWLFSKSLWNKAGKALMAKSLNPWLCKSMLANAQTLYEQASSVNYREGIGENDIEPLLKLAAINIWLDKQHRSADPKPSCH